MSSDPDQARTLLDLVPAFPTLVWGRDQLHAGDMWNSNSLIAWLLARSDHDLTEVRPPGGGRAPGWNAGLHAARLHDAAVVRPERIDRSEALRTIAALPSFLARHNTRAQSEQRSSKTDDLRGGPHLRAQGEMTCSALPPSSQEQR
jgi:hypothetical protein